MKRICIVLMVLLAAGLYAEGKAEVPKEITLLADSAIGVDTVYAIERLAKDFPEVKVNVIALDLSDGSTLTMDAQLAAGTPPNVYRDFIGRVSKYFVPEFALDLTGRVRDLDKYSPGVLEPYTRNGQLFGLPQHGGVQGFAVNLDITDAVGFEVRDDWTIAEFLDLAERVKQKYGGKKYVTGLFAANQSGDYLVNNWFESFGVKRYKSGDYSRTTIRETGGAKVYEFFQTLVKSGYVRSDSAMLTDDDYVIHWASAEIAGGAFFPAWTASYFKTVIEKKMIDKEFRYRFVPFPRAPGVEKVPTYFSGGAVVVHRTGTDKDIWAARLAEYLNDAWVQEWATRDGVVPTRIDVVSRNKDLHVLETQKIAQEQGLMDVGLTTPLFAATRPQHFPVLQRVLNLAITPEDAIAEYEKRLNEALK